MHITPQIPPGDKSDLRPGGWIDHYLPEPSRPYAYLMRLDRPIGTWLVLLPGWWSLALAFPRNPDLVNILFLMTLFGIGALIMRGAGCVVNDLWDRDIDGKVERTRTRPLVAGTVTVQQAIIFSCGLSLIGLFIIIQMNLAAIITALCSVPLIIFYPLMKRYTWIPQLFLGFTFNFGALIGCAAMTGGISVAATFLYIAGIFWTLGYDTIYAHMDKMDDEIIKVKSTALLLGSQTIPAISVFYAGSTFFLFLALYQGAASLMVLLTIAVIAAGFIWQIRQINIHDPAHCLALFKKNRDQGLLILAAIIICVYMA